MRTLTLLFALLFAPLGCIFIIPSALVGAGAGALLGSDIRVKEGAAIQVSYERPVDAALIGPNGRDTTYLAGASRLVGRARAIRGDTLWVTVSEAYVATDQRVRYDRRRAPEAVVIQQPGVQVVALGDQMAYIATGALLGGGLAIATVWILCAQNGCFD